MQRVRGLGRLKFTLRDVADVSGLSLETVRRYGRGVDRRFNPRSLESVVRFVLSRRADLGATVIQRP